MVILSISSTSFFLLMIFNNSQLLLIFYDIESKWSDDFKNASCNFVFSTLEGFDEYHQWKKNHKNSPWDYDWFTQNFMSETVEFSQLQYEQSHLQRHKGSKSEEMMHLTNFQIIQFIIDKWWLFHHEPVWISYLSFLRIKAEGLNKSHLKTIL